MRLPSEVIDRLDALCARTQRSRGTYLRMAVAAMLPLLESDHWAQQAREYERATFEREFIRITSELMDEDGAGS
ncbi:ribbon-helix-helix protein, CopG family [Gordonia sihwensis]|uniref:ribbon-helix-helix protein, CopG family n=1 Tax=Gordonia sihwensis TaxID=173559 RepID=UPI001E545900|nr:ribbon-helix-helix protein, CopG family [Gordonia sihwensis]